MLRFCFFFSGGWFPIFIKFLSEGVVVMVLVLASWTSSSEFECLGVYEILWLFSELFVINFSEYILIVSYINDYKIMTYRQDAAALPVNLAALPVEFLQTAWEICFNIFWKYFDCFVNLLLTIKSHTSPGIPSFLVGLFKKLLNKKKSPPYLNESDFLFHSLETDIVFVLLVSNS